MSPSDPYAFVTFASSRPAARCPGTFHRKSGRSLAKAVGLGGFVLLAAALLSASDCIPISEAGDHIGETKCVAGKVLKIRAGAKGVHFLLYDGRPEIILNHISQVSGGAAMVPPLPKSYDVENRGHFSAGHLHPTKKPGKTKTKPQTTATYGNDVEGTEPPE
jgi:hypothetical protein